MDQDEFAESGARIGYALLRIVLGIDLIMRGIGWPVADSGRFTDELSQQFAQALPEWNVNDFALMLSAFEVILGLLLLIGLRTRATLIVSSLLILTLTFGSGLVQDWKPVATQLLFALVCDALIFLHKYDGWSVDRLMVR